MKSQEEKQPLVKPTARSVPDKTRLFLFVQGSRETRAISRLRVTTPVTAVPRYQAQQRSELAERVGS
jgi:hypothetical protein